MILGLIPARLKSTRLKKKALLDIGGLPMVIRTYKNAIKSKLLDDLIICTDSLEIKKISNIFNCKCVISKQNHQNGTSRIAEEAKKYRAKLIIDIQGDEPLINSKIIDRCISFHKKNINKFEIVLPTQEIKDPNSKHDVKVVFNEKKRILFFSRSPIPYNFKKKKNFYKQLSVISFKPNALQEFAKNKITSLEKVENIELIRSIELSQKIGTFLSKSKSFSVDTYQDLVKARKLIKNKFI